MSTLALLSLLWWRNSIIVMLLSLEALMIILFMISSSYLKMSSLYALLLFLSLMVMGSSLGLSLMVAVSRSHLNTSSLTIWNMNFDPNHNIIINYIFIK